MTELRRRLSHLLSQANLSNNPQQLGELKSLVAAVDNFFGAGGSSVVSGRAELEQLKLVASTYIDKSKYRNDPSTSIGNTMSSTQSISNEAINISYSHDYRNGKNGERSSYQGSNVAQSNTSSLTKQLSSILGMNNSQTCGSILGAPYLGVDSRRSNDVAENIDTSLCVICIAEKR